MGSFRRSCDLNIREAPTHRQHTSKNIQRNRQQTSENIQHNRQQKSENIQRNRQQTSENIQHNRQQTSEKIQRTGNTHRRISNATGNKHQRISNTIGNKNQRISNATGNKHQRTSNTTGNKHQRRSNAQATHIEEYPTQQATNIREYPTQATKMDFTKQQLAVYILLHLCCLICHCRPQYGQRQNLPSISSRSSFFRSPIAAPWKGSPDSLPVIVQSSQIFKGFERSQQDLNVLLPSPIKLCPYGSSDPDCL